MNELNQPLNALHDIQRLMKRSSRFISLSGLSGIAAGLCALAGSWVAKIWLEDYNRQGSQSFDTQSFHQLKLNLLLTALVVVSAAILSAFYFTWRQAGRNNLPVWDLASKALVVNMLIPMVAGAIFILALLQLNEWWWVCPCCLIFYGLALVNGSKYTFSVIRYLGLLEITLGLLNTQFVQYGLYFWATGFGLLHIIYGLLVWWKNERHPTLL
ncbi:MAG: hypothetical protein NVS9B7_16340 [Flavisolibacter sp.]